MADRYFKVTSIAPDFGPVTIDEVCEYGEAVSKPSQSAGSKGDHSLKIERTNAMAKYVKHETTTKKIMADVPPFCEHEDALLAIITR